VSGIGTRIHARITTFGEPCGTAKVAFPAYASSHAVAGRFAALAAFTAVRGIARDIDTCVVAQFEA
jgi:hypothetical protein